MCWAVLRCIPLAVENEAAVRLQVVQFDGETGHYRIRYGNFDQKLTDTSHDDIAEALDQAGFECGADPTSWILRLVLEGTTVSSQREIQVFKLSPSRCNRQAQHHLLRRAEVDAFFTVLSGNANPIDRFGGSGGFGGVISPPSASNTGLNRARVLRLKVSRRTDKPSILFRLPSAAWPNHCALQPANAAAQKARTTYTGTPTARRLFNRAAAMTAPRSV